MYDPTARRWTTLDPDGFEAGDSDLYRFLNNGPTNATDPSGLETQHKPGNKYGSWDVTQDDRYDPNDKEYHSDATIVFHPNPNEVDASEIAFVQSVRIVDANTLETTRVHQMAKDRMVDDGYFLDRGYDSKYGWIGLKDDNTWNKNPLFTTFTPGSTNEAATLHDRAASPWRGVRMELDTVAIAKAGKDKGKIYGAVRWGFLVDAEGKITDYGVVFNEMPPEWWTKSVQGWNDQCTNFFSDKRHDQQQPLGPFQGVDVSPPPSLAEEIARGIINLGGPIWPFQP